MQISERWKGVRRAKGQKGLWGEWCIPVEAAADYPSARGAALAAASGGVPPVTALARVLGGVAVRAVALRVLPHTQKETRARRDLNSPFNLTHRGAPVQPKRVSVSYIQRSIYGERERESPIPPPPWQGKNFTLGMHVRVLCPCHSL